MSKPMDLSVDSFRSEVLEAGLPVLVDFWSPTCPHCQHLGPHFETAGIQQGDRVKFVKVSVADARPLFGEYRVSAVPTLVLFVNGAEATRRQGSADSDEITAWLTECLQEQGTS